MDKRLIIRIGLAQRYKILFTDSLGKFTKHLSLLWLSDRIVNFQNSFVSTIFSKYTMSIQHWHAVQMTSQYHFKVVSTSCLYCDNSYNLRSCSTCNSLLCLRHNNIKSVFDSVRTVVAVTPCPFIFVSKTGRQFAILFGFCVYNFLVEIMVYWFYTLIMIMQTMSI